MKTGHVNYPGRLDEAVADWLKSQDSGSLRQAATGLSETYRAGRTSAAASLAAYLVTRLPATYAANAQVLNAVAARLPHWEPRSLVDVGSGPGTASWAALSRWPSLAQVSQLETSSEFLGLAAKLNAESGLPPLQSATIEKGDMRVLAASAAKADLVLASYVLAEVAMDRIASAVSGLWSRTLAVLILIEPGTPAGFARIRLSRDVLLKQEGFIVGPCTHNLSCPMARADWCHFKVRLQRSRAHMHAKGATVPFEDEPFSWLAVGRQAPPPAGGRIVAPPRSNKAEVRFRVCRDGMLADVAIASRYKAKYKAARNLQWGGLLP